MEYGFPKSRRLLKRREFRTVYDTGTPYHNAGFHLFVVAGQLQENQAPAPTRIGLTVTRDKGGAVVRNRLRRWARETFRLSQDRIRPGFDLALNFHRSLVPKDRAEFDRLFLQVLRKARVLNDEPGA
jgi:ribonuclease P protein component